MELRRATVDDLAVVGDLTVAAYDEFTGGPEDGYVDHLRDAARRFREAELWVATEGEALLGTVTYCPPGSPWREIALADDEGEFRMLATDPRSRSRGAGTALVRLCEQRAIAHGATRMVLSSLDEMASAHRVYGRLGYVRLPERDWSPVPGVHLIAFTKELS